MALYHKFAAGLRGALNTTNRHGCMKHQYATIKQQTTKEKLRDLHIPLRPKKPLTPYFRFLKDFRVDFIKQNPESKVTEIVKQAAQDWAKANSSVKEKYTAEYQHEMQDYSKKILEYSSRLTPLQKETIKEFQKEKLAHKKKRDVKKKQRDYDKPKRPIGAYMQFLLEKAKESDKKMVELMRELKGHWQTMPEEEKHRYVALYEADKQRYDLQMAEWEQRMIAAGNTDIVRQSALATHKSKPSRLSKAEKPKQR